MSKLFGKNACVFFLFSLPFVSAFALSQAVTLPVVFVLLALFFLLVSNGLILNKSICFLFFFFMLVVLISANINAVNFLSSTPLNHIVSFLFCFIYFSVTYSFLSSSDTSNYNVFFKVVFYGVILSAIVALIEFSIVNFLNVKFDYFPRPAISDYEPLALGGLFVRSRGFAEESGHFAMYLISMYLLVYSFVKNNYTTLIVNVSSGLVILAIVSSFSVSGIVFGVSSFVLISFAQSLSKPKKFFYTLLLLLVVLCFIEYIVHSLTGYSIMMDVVVNKLSDSGSMTDRTTKLSTVYNFVLEHSELPEYLFGFGPAFYETYNLPSIVSLYPLIYVQFGLFGSVSFFALFCYPVLAAYLNNSLIDRYVVCSYVFCALFFLGISNYWFPWFWVVLAVICEQSKKNSASSRLYLEPSK